MSFHKSNFGSFGESLPCDMNGYVPQEGDSPWDFAIDHGTEKTHNEDGSLTEYGIWWEEEGFPEWQDKAVQATKQSDKALSEWRKK